MKSFGYIFVATLISLLLALRLDNCQATAEEQHLAPIVRSDTVRLAFGGDLMQHLPQVEAARTDEGFDYSRSFEYVTSTFAAADIAVVNLETTLTITGRYSGYPCFASPVELADAMVDMGIDIALLANNHCLDRGAQGVATTIEQLNLRGIAHTGAYCDSADYRQNHIVRIESHGVRFALVNYTYGTNGIPTPKGCVINRIDTLVIQRDIAQIDRDNTDCIIACMHWGNEYERRQNREQERLYDVLRRAGADIVIGSHPHVIQPYKADSTEVVFYSLGNLVSNQQRRYRDGGLIAQIEVVKCDTIEGVRLSAQALPVWVLCPDYRILPSAVADTLTMSTEARNRYECFMNDTESLLGNR